MAIDFTPDQNEYENLSPFKTWLKYQINTWGFNNFPFLENDFDQLTEYGMMMKLMKSMYQVIENQNLVEDDMNKLYTAYTELQTYIDNAMEEFENSVNNQVQSLEDYMNNYFANLDVQEEINNKLDQMLEDGVLEQIIEQFLQTTASWCFDTVDDMKSSTNLINGSYAQTMGYHTKNDGGKALYKITNQTPSNYYETLNSGLYAELIVGDTVCPEMFGAYGDSDHDGITGHDDTQAIQAMFDSGYEIFSLRKCIYKITSSIIVHQFNLRNMTIKGEIAYTGTGYAIDFTMDTGRVAECQINFGNIFSKGGCIAFRPHNGNSNPVAGLQLSGNIFYASSGANNPNGDCIFVDNDGWFNENFIRNINFQHGNYAFRCVYKEGSSAQIDLGHLVFDECHFEGVSNGVYVDVSDITGHNPGGIVFQNCRMVEAISGSFCNLQLAETNDSASMSCVVVNNDVYSVSKLIGDSLYVIPNGYSTEKSSTIRTRGQSDKLIYNGIVLNPAITDLGQAVTNISTDSSNKTQVDLTTNILPLELRGGNDSDYYVQINTPQLTFYTMVKIPITAWNDKIYHLTIPTRTQTMYVTLQCATHEIRTLYIDYYGSRVFLA